MTEEDYCYAFVKLKCGRPSMFPSCFIFTHWNKHWHLPDFHKSTSSTFYILVSSSNSTDGQQIAKHFFAQVFFFSYAGCYIDECVQYDKYTSQCTHFDVRPTVKANDENRERCERLQAPCVSVVVEFFFSFFVPSWKVYSRLCIYVIIYCPRPARKHFFKKSVWNSPRGWRYAATNCFMAGGKKTTRTRGKLYVR